MTVTALYQKIREAKKHVDVQAFMMEITPSLASEMIKCNTHNRKIRHTVVAKYVLEILAGEWYPTASGIGFDSNGVLLDGQHRIQAIIDANTPAMCLVVLNLPPASQEKVDRQTRRNLTDVFIVAGLACWKQEVQIATFLARRGDGRVMENGRFQFQSPPDCAVRERLSLHSIALKAILSQPQVRQEKGLRVGSLAAIVLYYEAAPEKALEFLRRLRNGFGSSNDEPAKRLNIFLKQFNTTGGVGQETDFKKTLFAINAFHKNLSIGQLKEATSLDLEPAE